MIKLKIEKTKFEYLLSCPFDKSREIKIGDYNCCNCKNCIKEGNYIYCYHENVRNVKVSQSNKYLKLHVTVLARNLKTLHIVEGNYYGITKKESIERFLSTHNGVTKSKEHCIAVWDFEFNKESKFRNRRLSKGTIGLIKRNK